MFSVIRLLLTFLLFVNTSFAIDGFGCSKETLPQIEAEKYNLTSFLNFTDSSRITADSSNRVSSVANDLRNENLVLWSEDLVSGWTGSNAVVLNATTFRENTATNTHYVYNTAGISVVTGTNYRFQARVKPPNNRYLRLNGSGHFGNVQVEIDNSGAVVATFNSPLSVTVTPAGSGFYDVSFTKVATGTGTAYFAFYLIESPSGLSTYTGDGATSAEITRMQVQTSSADPTYYKTTSTAYTLTTIANFTQGTDANKPLLSRADNKENLQIFSNGSFSDTTYWTNSNITTTDAAITVGTLSMSNITATTSTSQHSISSSSSSQVFSFVSENYEQSWLVKMGTHRYIQIAMFNGPFTVNDFLNFDLQTGTVGTTGVGAVGGIEPYDIANGVYRIYVRASGAVTANTGKCFLIIVPSASATRGQSFAAAGTESVYIANAQFRRTSTDSTYLATTTFPQYAGVNGRQSLVFNGAQALASTSAESTVFANNAKLLYLVINAALMPTVSAQYLYGPTTGNNFRAYLNSLGGSSFGAENHDGAFDSGNAGAALGRNTPVILRARHDGVNVYLSQDTGNGFIAEASFPSGNTTSLAEVLSISRTSSGFYGQIQAIATAREGTPKPDFEQVLRDAVFTNRAYSVGCD